MLVVITIIGILVALLIPAGAAVVRRAKNAAMAAELENLARAVETYKSGADDFPPDFSDINAVVKHISSAYPRNTRNVTAWWGSTDANGRAFNNLDPSEALPFWLSQLSTNPRDPLSGAASNYAGERKEIFEFQTTQLTDVDNDGWPEYAPKHALERPYVYFDGRLLNGTFSYVTAVYPKQATAQPAPVAGEVVRPYRSTTLVNVTRDHKRTKPFDFPTNNPPQYNITEWVNPGKFQIVCAGLDNNFGTDNVVNGEVVFKTFPEPNYALVDVEEDNITSFSEAKTLVDAVP
jgi:type II secretory pathway pseudopilin PulG